MPRLTLTLLIGALVTTVAAAAERRPNFIFVLSDDIAQGDLGCLRTDS